MRATRCKVARSMSERGVEQYDVLLIGAGIMSATVGTLLKLLEPSLRIALFERLEKVAGESSDARNNAGTGHSALCELNYTPQREDGSVEVKKAFTIMEAFEVSKQLWASLVERGVLPNADFIRSVPHLSFVQGEADVEFLRRRHDALHANHLFAGMRFSDDPTVLAQWMPLMMEGRVVDRPLAATWSSLGTDVDFGALTRAMMGYLQAQPGVRVFLDHHVHTLEQDSDQRWLVHVEDEGKDEHREVRARFVFIGAGGGALELLEASGIEEGEGYGGFPVSGQWLVCKNPELVRRHAVKVYGKAGGGAPPMSVPHLDRRFLDGKPALMFGPFAGFSTRFLKEGSYLDLPASLTIDNLLPLISAGLHNLGLTKYLLSQVTQSFEDKCEALREFIPGAKGDDWELQVAGQRVQVIKKAEDTFGKLEFGTEIISARDNTVAALLGASPGASTAVSIALDLLADCFPDRMETQAWREGLASLIPSVGHSLSKEPEFAAEMRTWTTRRLRLG